MAINSYFFNAIESGGEYDRVYDAQDFTNYLDKIVGDGVFPNPTTNLQVRANSGLNIYVGAGQGWIKGHKMELTADMSLSLDTADPVVDRVDRVIFYVDWELREMGINILKGTTSGAVDLTRDSSRWELCLAEITIPRQATRITDGNIRDTRGNSDLCGWVQGLIQQLSSTELFAQFQTIFNETIQAQTTDFMGWYEEMKDQLDQDAAGHLQNEIDALSQSINERLYSIEVLLEKVAYFIGGDS